MKQNGYIMSGALLLLTLAGCSATPTNTTNEITNDGVTINNTNPQQTNETVTTNQTTNSAAEDGTTNVTGDVVVDTSDWLTYENEDYGLIFKTSPSYEVSRSTEKNRRGSEITYNFTPQNGYKSVSSPYLAELQIHTENSIKSFNEYCDTVELCFEGDYPNLTNYNQEKEQFNVNQGLVNYHERSYIVTVDKVTGDEGYIRSYVTFIQGTRLEVWVYMKNQDQTLAADKHFKEHFILN